MTTETENQIEEATEQQDAQPSYFEGKPVPGLTTLNKGNAKFEVTSASDVTVYDTGRGVQVKKAEETASPRPFDISDDFKTGYAYGTTLAAPDDGPASIATKGTVTLVNTEAEALEAAEKAEAETAEESETAEKAEAETGIRLNFGKYKATGQVGGKEFDIWFYEHAVDVYANRTQVKPAAEPSTETNETETRLTLSNKFNRAVLEGTNVKVRIELDANGEDVVYTKKGGRVKTVSAAEAGIEAGTPGVEVNGDVTRLILAGGKVFDVNTTNGNVTAYVTGDEGIDNGGDPDLAGATPTNTSDFQIAISADGKRISLNNTGVEQSEDGNVAVSLDGITQLKPAAQSPSAIAAAEEKIGKLVEDGWQFLVNVDGKDVLVGTEDLGTVRTKKAGKLINKLRKNTPTADLPDDNTLKLLFANAAKFDGLKTDGHDYDSYYQTNSGNVINYRGHVMASNKFSNYSVRAVCTRPSSNNNLK